MWCWDPQEVFLPLQSSPPGTPLTSSARLGSGVLVYVHGDMHSARYAFWVISRRQSHGAGRRRRTFSRDGGPVLRIRHIRKPRSTTPAHHARILLLWHRRCDGRRVPGCREPAMVTPTQPGIAPPEPSPRIFRSRARVPLFPHQHPRLRLWPTITLDDESTLA